MNLPKVVIFMSVKDVVLAVLFSDYGNRHERINDYNCTMQERGVKPATGKLGRLWIELKSAQREAFYAKRFTVGYVKAVRKYVELLQLVEDEAAKKANLTPSDVQQALRRAQVKVDLLADVWDCNDSSYVDIVGTQLTIMTTLQLAKERTLSAEEYAAAYDMTYEAEFFADRRFDMLLFRSNWLFRMERRPGLSSRQKDAVCVLRDMPLSEWLNGEASRLMREAGLVVR